MPTSDAEKLAQFVRSKQPEFKFYETIDGNYNHIGATVADAILQANRNYKTLVKPRVNRILAQYPNSRTTSAVLNLLQSIGPTKFLNLQDADRADRFSQVLELFAAEGIETDADLREWLSRKPNLRKLRAIKGIGPKTVDYLKILVGESTSAIDRHLFGFLKAAGLSAGGYTEAQSIINATADILGVDRAQFDHSIWQYMSKKHD
jgi:thermostable 8-oxoguanine DNA glycosylase